MPDNTRNRVASQRIDGPILHLTIWGPPDADGNQAKAQELSFDTNELPEPTRQQLCAIGAGRAGESRWNRKDAEAVPAVMVKLWDELRAGTWAPGRTAEADTSPTDLQLAVAEAYGQPIHVVQHEFENRMKYVDRDGNYVMGTPDPQLHTLYKDARGRTRHFFDKEMQARLAQRPQVAAALVRIAQKRAADARKAPHTDALPDDLFGSPAASPQDAAAD